MCNFANDFIPKSNARAPHQMAYFVLRVLAFTGYSAILNNYVLRKQVKNYFEFLINIFIVSFLNGGVYNKVGLVYYLLFYDKLSI